MEKADRNATATVTPWHARELTAVMVELNADSSGLSSAQAAQRLQTHGPNLLPQQKAATVWEIFGRQFHSPLIYVLAIAGVVSIIIHEYSDAGFIFAVLILNAIIGTFQEWKAEQSSRALQRLVRGRATVVRDGESCDVDAETVVPGDIVWLESGNRVPADIRLISAHSLEVNESLLTGESLSVEKHPEWTGPPLASLGDRLNMAFAGSVVARGRGTGIVVGTGMQTAVGRLARDMAATVMGKPPLVVRMERFARFISIVVLIAAVFVMMIGTFGHGHDLTEMFMFAVAMAVSAIPEGLPVAMTVVLSIAMVRMSRRGVIVRRMTAVEGLGSCTLIATDKTGTLTCNELTVRRLVVPTGETFSVTGEGYRPIGDVQTPDGTSIAPKSRDDLDAVALASAFCNEASLHKHDDDWAWRGDPTDIALLALAHKLGREREPMLTECPEINRIPFESEHKYAAAFHRDGQTVRVFVKGAPERILSMCAWNQTAPTNSSATVSGDGSATASEDDAKKTLVTPERAHELAAQLASEGYRVLGLADGILPDAVPDEFAKHSPAEPVGLRFVGLVGMIDPARPGVREAIATCHRAGIGVAMVTGDHPITALAIARDLGIASEPKTVITGVEMQKLTPAEWPEIVEKKRVFARVSPHQKLQIVEAAQKAGHFVAVTGDGVNDAPALRKANIGVSMGKGGTDVAREASELVITDDNFATIVAGVEEGRVAFDNLRKVIFLLVSTGAAELVLIMLCLILGLPLPLVAVQILWLNLVTNGIQHVALAFEPKESDVLKRKPRKPDEPIFNRLMIERTVVAALVMGTVGFFMFWHLKDIGYELVAAQNLMLMLMVLFENVHIGNCRSETVSAFRLAPWKSPILLAGTLCAFLIHLLALYFPPLQQLLGTQPLTIDEWIMVGSLALTVIVAMEIHKWTWAMRFPPPPTTTATPAPATAS